MVEFERGRHIIVADQGDNFFDDDGREDKEIVQHEPMFLTFV